MIYSILYLRFILAMSVVTLHFFSVYSQLEYVAYLTMAVDIFFVLAGFIQVISTQKEKRPLRYMWKRIKRIIPLYWLMLVTGYIGIMIFTSTDRSLIESIFLIPIFNNNFNHDMQPLIISQAWTLQFDLILYIFFCITFIFINDNRAYYYIISAFVIITLLSLFGVHSQLPYLTAIFNNMVIFFEYTLGMILGLLYTNTNLKNYKSNKLGAFFLVIGIAGMLYAFYNFGIGYGRGITVGIPSFIAVLGVLILDVKEGNSVLLGKLSYPIYISQTISIFAFATFTKIYFPGINFMLIFPISISLALIIGFVFLKIDQIIFSNN